ncbi:MAG: leucine-rich repeat protein [Treponema sp.]|nr:leucine-rich repeat protein [Treponema sp.]
MKSKFLVLVSICLFLGFLVSCSDIITNATPAAGSKAEVSFTLNDTARTIMPSRLTASEITEIVLTAKKDGDVYTFPDTEDTKISWSADAQKSALDVMQEAKVTIDFGTYDFSLDIYVGNPDSTILAQKATLSTTVTSTTQTLAFGEAKNCKETGDVEVTLTFASNARIGRVKAGLFKDIQCATPLTYTLAETDTELSCDLEIISIEDGKTEGLKKAVYRKSDIPNGTYYIKFSVHDIETDADGNEIETQLNTIMDVLKVKGYITTGECTLSAVNTIYSIEYKLGGGSWADNFAPTEKRNANTGILLPTKTDLTVPEGCVFAGWYEVDEKGAPTDTDENGNPVILTKIGTGTDTAKDYLLSALWKAKPAFDASIIVNTSDIDANYEQNNATLTFTVTPPDNDATYSYQWTVDGAEKEPTTSAEFTVDGSTWATGMYDISLVVTETKTDSESGETKTKYYSYTAQINWTRLYTILFDITGAPEGTNVPVSQYIEENGTVATPKDSDGNEITPTYGWYTNSNFSNAFDLTETVTKSMTLYGCWDLNGNIYVSENGTDDDGRGTAGNPLATIASALALMTDSNTDYTIYIDGTISGEQKIQSPSALAKSITLTGKNGPDSRNEPQDALYGGFKAESSGRTLTVNTTVPVIIENLKITGGYLTDSGSFGGGLSVASGADVTLTGYTQITGNTATRGGGVDVDGTLTMKDSALISGNTATALYGGGAYVGSNGVLDMQAGEIFGNDISGTPSDGEEKQGYGVYVCGSSGKLKIGGSAVIGNDDDTVPNDVYLASGTKIIITSELMGGVTTATITPSSYSTTTQWIEADVDDNGNPVVDLATECTSFAVTPQTITDSATGTTRTINWRITETGYLQQYVDTADIVSQISKMTESGTVTVTGFMQSGDLSTIVTAMKEKCPEYTSNPDVLIKLDLSNATGLTKISGEFADVWNIRELVLPEGLTTIKGIGRADSLATLNIPSTVTTIGELAFYRSHANLTLDEGNTTFVIKNNALYTKDEKTLVAYAKKFLESDTEPSGTCEVLATTEEILPGAFSAADNLKTLTFAEGSVLKKIGNQAFDYCTGLESVVLPDSVDELGDGVFQYAQVTSIVLSKNITAIPASTFSNNDFTSIVIPDGVTSIGREAFWACRSLQAITLPASLESIDTNAFGSCDALTTVNYKGTAEQKESMTINDTTISELEWVGV